MAPGGKNLRMPYRYWMRKADHGERVGHPSDPHRHSGNKRLCARARTNCDCFSIRLPKRSTELIWNTDAGSATRPASVPWDMSASTTCSGRICMISCIIPGWTGLVSRWRSVEFTEYCKPAKESQARRTKCYGGPMEQASPLNIGPIRSGEGAELVGAVVAFIDITDRKLDMRLSSSRPQVD